MVEIDMQRHNVASESLIGKSLCEPSQRLFSKQTVGSFENEPTVLYYFINEISVYTGAWSDVVADVILTTDLERSTFTLDVVKKKSITLDGEPTKGTVLLRV